MVMIRILLLIFFVAAVSCKDKTMFERVDPAHSNMDFNNTIADNDTLNVLDVENIYNGGGVGIADFNNDGLQDVYFAGNIVPNRLYLNKGNFLFQDITGSAGVNGHGRWSRGVSTVDINNDGLMDIYVSASLMPDKRKRENLLYINQGIDNNGLPRFLDRASEYGLNDTSHSTMAAFFDYDNDGDLDMYLLVNEILKGQYPNTFRPVLTKGEHPNTDKLFRNDWDEQVKHPVFTNVSKEAGINIEGYGHGVNITDINRDGWNDIYVTNDFLSNNILYINDGRGHFTDKSGTYFKHTSENAMGQDVIDINNDGLVDVIELDMNPEDNFRKKMMLNQLSYQRFQNTDYFGYQYQYVRNTLQINQGRRMLQNDSAGEPIFSEVAFLSGIAETDWSWAPVVTDLDNDGYRDIIITNGFPKDVTDHDFIAFRNKANMLASKKEILEQIPEIKISNYVYKNTGGLKFADMTREWGMNFPAFSSGAASADLDNDGDMDFVVNNINGEASLFRNHQRELEPGNHYIQVQFKGDGLNRNGTGAWAELYYDHQQVQVYENTPYRGYLSSIQNIAHFGLGKSGLVDSLIIRWPGGKKQSLYNVAADRLIKVDIANAISADSSQLPVTVTGNLFREITDSLNMQYVYNDSDFVDFNIQKLLPHKFSEYGPALAAGDVDGNGLEDVVIGGSFFFQPQVFLQQENGRFVRKSIGQPASTSSPKNAEDQGILLFDPDNDNDLDLYISSGGYEAQPNSAAYRDRFYVNEGKGNFRLDTSALPEILTSKFCVRAADFDKDGDLDVFVAGRVDPWNYPKPVSSHLLRNDSKNGKVTFVDVTRSTAPALVNLGMVCDAVFTDYDNDGWQDLVLAGEWMPVVFLKNNQGRFEDRTSSSGIDNRQGWWNTIAPGDFDNDGDTDYIVGNLGENSFYRASEAYPVKIIAKDFDNNGSFDALPSLFLPATLAKPERKEFPAHLRDDMAKQMISMRSKFQNYKSYAEATMDQLLTPEQRKGAIQLQANYFASALLQNDKGRFTMIPLPVEAQTSVLNGMAVEDFDDDGNLDVVINGNDYGTEVSVGRYDALNGLYLKGDGQGHFSPLTMMNSGIFIPGNGKGLVMLRGQPGRCLLVAGQNRGPVKVFALKKPVTCLPLLPGDAYALIKYRDGKLQKRECYYGASFLSQSARFILTGNNIASIALVDIKGNKRPATLNTGSR